MQQTVFKLGLRDLQVFSHREGQVEVFEHQPLMQIFHLFFWRCRLATYGQAWAFYFNIQFTLFKPG
ncbi:hypothetical protein D3C86_1789010 [compost metagenome]